MATTSFSFTRGDSFRKKLNIYKNGELYTPVEGEIVKLNMKRSYTDEYCALKKEIPIDDLTLEIKPDDTKHLKYGNYVFEVELTDKDERVYTIVKGNITLEPEVG